MQSARPNAFLASIRNTSHDKMKVVFEEFFNAEEKDFSENLQFNSDEQKQFDDLMSGIPPYDVRNIGCYFLGMAIEKAENTPAFRPRLVRLLGANSEATRSCFYRLIEFIQRILPPGKLTELFGDSLGIKIMTGLLDDFNNKLDAFDSKQAKELFCYILDDILESACREKNLVKFNEFTEILNKKEYTEYRITLNFSAIIIEKAAKKLSFTDFDSLYPILKTKYHEDCSNESFYKKREYNSIEHIVMRLKLEEISHIENLLLIITPLQFLSKYYGCNVQGFFDCMRAVKIVCAATPLNTSTFIKECLGFILDELTPETSYDDVSKFLTLVNRELYGETKEDPSTLHPFLLQYCKTVSANPKQIAALMPELEDKENVTTNLFLKEIVRYVSSDDVMSVYCNLFHTSHKRSIFYFYEMLLKNEKWFSDLINSKKKL